MYRRRKPPEEPPCDRCRVQLTEENDDVIKIYLSTRRQYITAEQGHVVDINLLAVKMMMDLYGIRDQQRCMEKVVWLFHQFIGDRTMK